MKAAVHLVIPCFRESGRIPPFLEALGRELGEEGGVTLQVVEDGSGAEEQARMAALVESARTRHPFVLPPLLLEKNLGKGGAVHAGWKHHPAAEWLGFVDADGATPAPEVRRLIQEARRDDGSVSALFASRITMLGRDLRRHAGRQMAGRFFSLLVSTALRIPVHDSQCGLKLLRRGAWERIAPVLTVTDFGFDIELLAALTDAGCRVVESPVDWHVMPGGKLRFFRDAARMVRDIAQVRARRRTAAWRAALAAPDA